MPVHRRGSRGDSDDEIGDEETANPIVAAAKTTRKPRKRKRKGEGHRVDSWIWTVKRSSADDELREADDGM